MLSILTIEPYLLKCRDSDPFQYQVRCIYPHVITQHTFSQNIQALRIKQSTSLPSYQVPKGCNP